MDLLNFVALAVVAFCAATLQATTGFGFSVMSVPFFLLIMDSLAAIQVVVVINFVISLVLMRHLLDKAPRRLLLHLVIGSLAGFPVGLAAFRAADLVSMKLVVGLFITLFASILIVREWRLRTGDSRESGNSAGELTSRPVVEIVLGVVSGMMSIALAMPGPPVILYLLSQHVARPVSRSATLVLYFFSYASVSLVHTVWGGMTGESWWLAAKLTPFVIAGAMAGFFATRHLSEGLFRVIVLATLMVSGTYAVWAAL